jgi:hypothetical protein
VCLVEKHVHPADGRAVIQTKKVNISDRLIENELPPVMQTCAAAQVLERVRAPTVGVRTVSDMVTRINFEGRCVVVGWSE